MKRLIFFFLILLASTWVGSKLYAHPGYIALYYHHWVVETTPWFLSVLLLLFFLLGHWLLNTLYGITHLPKRIRAWRQTRQHRNALKQFNKGYFELLAGDQKKAEKELLKSAQNKELATLSYVIAAQAADEQQASLKRDLYLLQAKQGLENKDYLIDSMQVQFYLKNHQPEEALSLLTQLRQTQPKNRYLLKLITQTYLQLQDWNGLLTLLKALKKHRVFDKQAYTVLEAKVYLQLLKGATFTQFAQAQTLWKQIPKHVRHHPPCLIAYADHLRQLNQGPAAEALLRKELKKRFNDDLMEYYLSSHSDEPAKQIALAEKYLKEYTAPLSLRSMGMLCLRNQLWGQARDYLESSLKMQISAEAYSALGYVYEKLGENEKALRYYRKGLKTSSLDNTSVQKHANLSPQAANLFRAAQAKEVGPKT